MYRRLRPGNAPVHGQALAAAVDIRPRAVWLSGLLVLLVVLLTGCNKTQMSDRPPEPGDVAVARVNGMTIWSSDVRNEAVAQGQIGAGEPLDMTSDLFARTLQEVIDEKLLARQAQAKGLDKSLTAQRRLAAAQDRILGDMLVENTVDRDIDDKKVKEQYDEQVRLAKTSEEVRARLLLLKTKPDADAALKQLQGGAVFEAMAMEHSIDQATRFNGGDMGYFTMDIMPQAYKTALANAQVGQLVGPVQTPDGWAILRVEDRRPEQLPTLEEERPVITRYLVYNQVAGLLKDLRNNAKVEMLVKNTADGPDQEPASAPKGAFDDSAAAASGGDAAATADAMASSAASSASSSVKARPPAVDPKSMLLPGRDPTAGHHFFAPAAAKH
jgi:peptidyl-prolyl cis-trans isomerase C